MRLILSLITCLYQYTDYSSFLEDSFLHTKSLNPQWSYNSWAKLLKVKNGSTLIKIIRKQRGLGDDIVKKLLKYFDFNENDKENFNDIVHLSRIGKNSKIGKLIYSNLKRENDKIKKNVQQVSHSSEALHSFWSFVIPVLLGDSEVEGDIDKLYELPNLPKNIDYRGIAESLAKENYLIKGENGCYLPPDIYMEFWGKNASSEMRKKLHLDYIQFASSMIKNSDFSPEGDILSINYTFNIVKEDFPMIREKIKMAIIEIANSSVSPPGKGTSVCCLHSQFYPLK